MIEQKEVHRDVVIARAKTTLILLAGLLAFAGLLVFGISQAETSLVGAAGFAVYLVLAGAMLGLSFLVEKAPVRALLIACALYGILIVGAAVENPASLKEGLFMKIIIVAFLGSGLKSAFAARNAIEVGVTAGAGSR